MSDNTRLQFDSIGKSFFGVQVLKEITFGVSAGSIIGLVGENGAGKSTLMNILGGVLAPDAGTMTLDGVAYAPANPVAATRSGVVFVHQELNLFANLSIADNLFITDFPRGSLPPFISRRKASSQAEELLQRVGLKRDPTTTVDLLSPGERQQLEIAKALKGAPKLVILDEPTTSLTTRETDQLFALMEELREMGTSVIYISHILGDVQQLSDRVVILRDGTLVDQGPIEDFDSHTMVSRMVGRALDRLYPDKTAEIQPQVALEVEAVTEPGMVRDVSFSIRAGEVVGMFGLMGAGRSELARILFGLDPSSSGTVRVNGQERPPANPRASINAGIGFVTEDRREEGLLMEESVAKNIALAALPKFLGRMGFIRSKEAEQAALEAGESVRLKSASPRKQPVKSLSGGNQQKAVIAKWLLTEPDVLLLDEPTRGVDVGAKHEIYRVIDQLAGRGTAVLLISSELPELVGTCDRILVMRQGEKVAEMQRDEFHDHAILMAAFGEPVGGKENPSV